MRSLLLLTATLSITTPAWAQSDAMIAGEVAIVERIVGAPLTADERARVAQAAHIRHDAVPAQADADEADERTMQAEVMAADPTTLARQRERVEQLQPHNMLPGDELLAKILDAHDPVLATAGDIRLRQRAVDGFVGLCGAVGDALGRPPVTSADRAVIRAELLRRFSSADPETRKALAQSASAELIMRPELKRPSSEVVAKLRATSGSADTPGRLIDAAISLVVAAEFEQVPSAKN